jgi:hypothetical protein
VVVGVVTWGGTPLVNTWYFVVGWHDSVSNTIKIQVNNGTPVSAAYANGASGGSGVAFRVGAWDNASNTQRLDGKAQGVGVVRRVLTSNERTYLFNSGAAVRTYAEISAASP